MEKTIDYWNNRPEVYEMPYKDFYEEYSYLLPIMAEKEGNGHLDFYKNDYIPMTNEEIALHEKDWRAFSRLRGYSEYDIAEYGRWHKLTGQTDGLMPAINDPWRRPRDPALLYVQHLDYALERGIHLSETVQKDYDEIKNQDNEDPFFRHASQQKNNSSDDDDFDFDAFFDDNNNGGSVDIDWDKWDDPEWDDNPVSKEEQTASKTKKHDQKISSLRKRLKKRKTFPKKMNLALWKKIKGRTLAD